MNESTPDATPEPMPDAAADSTSESEISTTDASSSLDQAASSPWPPSSSAPAGETELPDLPERARRLLRIQLPVRVTLAAQRKPIQEILELGPGSIVKFDKTCDEPLEFSVGNQTIARGEVVKVGDKFGLRIGALLLPGAI